MRFTIFAILILLINWKSAISQEKAKLVKWQEKPVMGVAFSPDGNLLATVGADKKIKIWDVNDGELINTLYDNVSGEVSISFSPDGKSLVSGSWDQSVKIWNIATGEVTKRLWGHEKSLRTACYSPSGNFIASAGWDKEIIIWHTQTGIELKRLYGHDQCIRAIDYSPNGKYLASGGYDLFLRVHEIATGREVMSLKGHKYPIESLSFSPDGKYIATGGNDNIVKIWDLKSHQLVKELRGHTDGIYSISYSPDGKYIASGGNDFLIKIWNVETEECIKTIDSHTLTIKSLAFSPKGDILVSGSADKSIRFWDVSFLNISPTNKSQIAESFNVNDTTIFKFADKYKKEIEVFDKNIKLKVKVKNKNFELYKLYVNKKLATNFNAKTQQQVAVVPQIVNTNDGYYELEFAFELNPEMNEVQIYVEKLGQAEFYVSKTIHIKYTQLNKYAQNTTLYCFDINPQTYIDKKIAKTFVSGIDVDLSNFISNQKNVIYKDVKFIKISDSEIISNKLLKEKFATLSATILKDDIVNICISGVFVSKMNKQYLLLPNASLKDISKSVFSLDSLIDKLLSKSKNINIYFNQTGKLPATVDDYFNTSADVLSKHFGIKLNERKTNSTITTLEMPGKSISELMKNSLVTKTDTNLNKAIEIEELNTYISQLTKTYFYQTGTRPPFYRFF